MHLSGQKPLYSAETPQPDPQIPQIPEYPLLCFIWTTWPWDVPQFLSTVSVVSTLPTEEAGARLPPPSQDIQTHIPHVPEEWVQERGVWRTSLAGEDLPWEDILACRLHALNLCQLKQIQLPYFLSECSSCKLNAQQMGGATSSSPRLKVSRKQGGISAQFFRGELVGPLQREVPSSGSWGHCTTCSNSAASAPKLSSALPTSPFRGGSVCTLSRLHFWGASTEAPTYRSRLCPWRRSRKLASKSFACPNV